MYSQHASKLEPCASALSVAQLLSLQIHRPGKTWPTTWGAE
jgi:hypothetical protein